MRVPCQHWWFTQDITQCTRPCYDYEVYVVILVNKRNYIENSLYCALSREESIQMNQDSIVTNTQAQSTKDLLTITIEIGNGRNENIYINEGDSPR